MKKDCFYPLPPINFSLAMKDYSFYISIISQLISKMDPTIDARQAKIDMNTMLKTVMESNEILLRYYKLNDFVKELNEFLVFAMSIGLFKLSRALDSVYIN